MLNVQMVNILCFQELIHQSTIFLKINIDLQVYDTLHVILDLITMQAQTNARRDH